MAKINGRQAAPTIAARKDFTSHGALSAKTYQAGRNVPRGSLPRDYWEELDALDIETYVVFSYDTPIAWHAGKVWTRPDVKYSMTTSHHQGRCPQDGTTTN